MKGSAEEEPAGVGLLVVALALLLGLCMIIGLLVIVVVDDDNDCGAATTTEAAVAGGVAPAPVTNPNAPLTARIATWNTYVGNTTGEVVAGLTGLTRVADVIGAQELFSAERRATVARALARQGWASVTGPDSAVPIFYNAAKYRLRASDTVQEFGLTRIENGPSGTSIGPRSLQWVQLQDLHTGADFFVVNDHTIPGIEAAGRPRTDAPRRLAIYRLQQAAVAGVIGKLQASGPVALTQDSNVDARADDLYQDPALDYVHMSRLGLVSNWTALGPQPDGTEAHSRRLIDKLWLTQGTARFVRHSQLGLSGSDHHPQVVTITKRVQNTAAASVPATVQLPASLTVPGLTLDADQVQIAATAIAVGKQFGIPERGWIVAIASGLQESGLRNLPGGDRDSAGWQQQRPSAGWGTLAQIRDVRLATMAFYGVASHTHNRGLTEVPGWQQLSIAAAAQAVQGSAFPTAYAKWETAATAIVAKLAGLAAGTGAATGSQCANNAGSGLPGSCPATNLPAEKVLSHDALLVLRCVAAQFQAIHDISTYPGHEPDESRAVDIMIPSWQSPAGKQLGDQIAAWVKAHQAQLGVQYVIWSAHIWNIERDAEGWRPYASITGENNPSSLHYNHVHVSVYGNRGTGLPSSTAPAGSGGWRIPVGQPFRVGCGFGCYPGHTGQDFPAAPGTPVYAVTDGTVIKSESITTTGTCTALPICGGTRISYGNLLVLRLAGSGDTTAWYAHLTARQVQVGDTVRAGQQIGTVGFQGHVIPQGPAGAHLHFEIRLAGRPISPMPFLRSKGLNP